MSRLFDALVLLVAVFCSGLFLGKHLQAGQQLKANQAGAELGQATYSQAVDQGASAVAAVLAHDAQTSRVQTAVETELSQNVRRTPLTLAAACGNAPGALPGTADHNALVHRSQDEHAGDRRGADASASASLGAQAAQDLGPGQVDGAVDLPLTLGAVRLWNAALAGELRDASLAADTCPADDPTASACAAGAGLSVRDAWHNHNANAAACTRDRSQLAELIALLHARESALANLKAAP